MTDPLAVLQSACISGAATCSATVFTNPLEVTKTRFQLQGELGDAKRPYRSILGCARQIAATEGAAGLQKGLLAAWGYQFFGNGIRLALFDHLKAFFNPGGSSVAGALAAGASAGVVSTCVAQPFYLIKVRQQAFGGGLGAQHEYRSVAHAAQEICGRGRGPLALWQGLSGAAMRSVVGSSVQLATFESSKRALVQNGVLAADNRLGLTVGASLLSGLVLTTAMEPFDTVTTRLCNQAAATAPGAGAAAGQAQLYRGALDCIAKTVRAEGAAGLFKGWASSYVRLGPHTFLMFLFWDGFKAAAEWAKRG